MDDSRLQSVATLLDSTTVKIQQLQLAFTELENHNTVTLNLKWKELEEHFHGLEISLKKKISELEYQEKEYDNKVFETQKMLMKRETVVVDKENTSLEYLQGKRDAAMCIITDAIQNPNKVLERSIIDTFKGETVIIIEEKHAVSGNKHALERPKDTHVDNMDAKPCPQLIKFCDEMDVKGLHKFISDNRKNLSSIRESIPIVLRNATDPLHLVLDSLEDFYHGELLIPDSKRETALLGLRRTCIMLMESLCPLLTDQKSDTITGKLVISQDVKEQAKAIAYEWKPKLDNLGADASSGNSLEAHAFLQLLATFDIANEFDQDEICNLILAISRRRQTADLCRSLGLSQKIPGIIQLLINSGRQIEAVNLAHAFKLTEQFPPVPLLKAYLKEARRVSQVKASAYSSSAQNEANDRELYALKAVIKCVEEHKLEEQYPVETLHKRVFHFEKAKAEKKRATEATKPQQPKRSRANGGGYGPRMTTISDKSFYRATERHTYFYDRSYLYGGENRGMSLLGPGSYDLSPSHVSIGYYGNGYQYQTPYLH